MQSKIILCPDIEIAISRVREKMEGAYLKLFECEEFKIDDAKGVTQEAYIAESRQKVIVIAAQRYRNEAQNALLKLLEEPPRNIVFIVIAPTKTALLATILSRIPLERIASKKQKPPIELDLQHLELEDIFSFVKKHARLGKGELSQMIEALLDRALFDAKISLNERELEQFSHAFHLAQLNARSQTLLLNLLLILYHARMRA